MPGAEPGRADVSVVIPSHNDLATLPEAIASVRMQTQAAFECIVVSDASDDGTDEWLREQDGVRFLSVSLASPAGARNAGIRAAQAPYVAFLDADDRWHPERLRLFAHQLADHPDGALWACTWRRQGLALRALGDGTWVAGATREVPRGAFLSMNQFQTSTVIARREALNAVGGFDPGADGAEDWDLWTRLAAVGRVWLTNAPLVTYRTGTGRVSSDGGRVYRQGVALLERQGAGPRALAWHHLRFAYAFRRQGKAELAAEALAAMPRLSAPERLALRTRFGLYLLGRLVRRVRDGVARRMGR